MTRRYKTLQDVTRHYATLHRRYTDVTLTLQDVTRRYQTLQDVRWRLYGRYADVTWTLQDVPDVALTLEQVLDVKKASISNLLTYASVLPTNMAAAWVVPGRVPVSIPEVRHDTYAGISPALIDQLRPIITDWLQPKPKPSVSRRGFGRGGVPITELSRSDL